MIPGALTIYARADSPRLRYVLGWLLGEQLGLQYELQTSGQDTSRTGISYGKVMPGCICIPDAGLLWEQDIQPFPVTTGTWEGIPTLFAGNREGAPALPFDLLSALFYLLSRYEEYFPFEQDRHGRYPATDSILYQQGWLERPLVDEWTEQFRRLLLKQGQAGLSEPPRFRFQPSYDIDIAWSYRHKGARRWMGGLLREGLQLRWKGALRRLGVGLGWKKDPYDAYEWLRNLHAAHGLRPLYFILAAAADSDFDKNIAPDHPAMQALIQSLQTEGETGLHPSYYSHKPPSTLIAEKAALEGVLGHPVAQSRQHFIRLRFPATYRLLLSAGIREDYSMGYSTQLGFRAGTGRSFLWYDLGLETETPLRVHPFCFMDTTARFDLRLPVSAAFEQLREIAELLREIHSPLVTVFHNFSLGTDPGWKGWREAYARFVTEMKSWEE